jgi:hypothetical protein
MSVEIIIGVIGLVVAIAAYQQGKKPTEIKLPPPTEEMDNLKANFKVNQRLSSEIQNLLEDYINSRNAGDDLFVVSGMTFSNYLNFVRQQTEESLSDKIYDGLSEPIYTRANIESMHISLMEQQKNLMMVKNVLISMK